MCKYCEGDTELILDIKDEYEGLYIDSKCRLVFIGSSSSTVNINFCPMCGRSLKEGE